MFWMKALGCLAIIPLVAVAVGFTAGDPAPRAREEADRKAAEKAYRDGNFAEAYDAFRALALAPATDGKFAGSDLARAYDCLRRLGRVSEFDALFDGAVDAHRASWRFLRSAAETLISAESFGYIVAGEFERGYHRGGGRYVNSQNRDRVRALRLLVDAMGKMDEDVDPEEAARFHLFLARVLLAPHGWTDAWRLQILTNLDELPDYDEGWRYGGERRGAPVDEEGNPVFHRLPESFEAARTDGERWRWALERARTLSADLAGAALWQLAEFLWDQFGVQTLAEYGSIRLFEGSAAEDADEGDGKAAGTWALPTLTEDETIARLADGIRRLALPAEFNFIRIFRTIARDADRDHAAAALDRLAQIFENRRQYPKAAETWREAIDRFGAGNNNYRKDRLRQIVDNWGRFEPLSTQPARAGATVEYRYRNGRRVEFEAERIRLDKLLEDVQEYLRDSPRQLDWRKLEIDDIGYRLVVESERKYVGETVAEWSLDLDPRPNHFDARITVATPLRDAGAYLLTAKMADGNTSKIVVWVADTTIVRKNLAGSPYYFVADAVTGEPIPGATVEFFGFRQRQTGRRSYTVDTLRFAEFTDADGQVFVKPDAMPRDHSWMVRAVTKEGRLAYLGFSGVWYGEYRVDRYDQVKVFTATDRPVYRPAQTMHYKLWIRRARYAGDDPAEFAGKSMRVEIHDPKGEKVFEKDAVTDEYGGIEGDYELPADAALGQYSIVVPNLGGGSFRVEEYKKPEFEVTIEAPEKPVALGETITARIRARYYFGAPVTDAKVHYKVLRSAASGAWYPPGPWDWLYGEGYGWFADDYTWYPGWSEWGCVRPRGWWWGWSPDPPEVVAEAEAEIGPDGTIEVRIDTALAKAIHGDQDHSYRIEAEVTDASRRTIVGVGSVLVARKPFRVFVWIDRGYARVGDPIRASACARTPDGKPVAGEGVFRLYRITYGADGAPVETEVQHWDADPDARGRAEEQMTASNPGQYRLAYTLTDANGTTIEGGYLFTVIGEGFDGSEYRFNPIEIVADKREYRPGEKVKLLVNTNRVGGTVLLFLRPVNGVYLAPEVLHLAGKSTTVEFQVTQADMPNFFVEALTVAEGRVYTDMKELVVPPESKVLEVEVEPSAAEYLPGAPAMVRIRLTGPDGEPFEGTAAISIYDKSVEYVSGGSNVPEIRAFFWQWRRSHYPQTESSLDRTMWNLVRQGEAGMGDLGVFGAAVPEEATWGEGEGRLRRGAAASGSRAKGEMLEFERRDLDGAPSGGVFLADSAEASTAAPGFAAGDDKGEAGATFVEPEVRKEFADTALWVGTLTTGRDGMAEVDLTMPENLTTWKIRTWALGRRTEVGEGAAEVVTTKNLLVRLQAPRFFVEKDEVVLSANIHNYLETEKRVRAVLELEGGVLEAMEDPVREVSVAAMGEARVDWRVRATAEGEAVVRMKALSDEESDAMEMRFPVKVHGMLKTESVAGAIRPDEASARFEIRVPTERRVEPARLEIRYSPTLAGAMVDALPYLANYPYGCTEQTLNRFLPTVIVHRILRDMGLDLEAIREKRANLNAQEIGDPAERAAQWRRTKENPVFDEAKVVEMVKEGVRDLEAMQVEDGGWGWFSGWGERSYPHTTAIVVHGLQLAAQYGIAVVPGVTERGVEWLDRYREGELRKLRNAPSKTKPYKTRTDAIDALVHLVLVEAGKASPEMADFLFRDRSDLPAYAKALFGLACEAVGDTEKLEMLMQNLAQYLVEDEENQTAYLRLPEGTWWWCWWGSDVEANAAYLKLLSRTDPKGRTASRLVKYLLNNRKHATWWSSTRDTALVVEAMAEFLRASGEDRPNLTIEVWMDGKKCKEVSITPETLFTFDDRFVLEGDGVESGVHTVEIRKRGTGPLYFNAYLTIFTLEDPIEKAGLEVRVDRKVYKLVRVEASEAVAGSRGQAVEQRVEKYRREEVPNLGTLTSGDLVEIELEIESKNDYEYLVFEDMKAAGFEPVEVRSGYVPNDLGAYVELRDDRVAFFARRIARGRHSVSYRLRAEIPGLFSALPARASAMYAPELRGNSDEIKLAIEDRER